MVEIHSKVLTKIHKSSPKHLYKAFNTSIQILAKKTLKGVFIEIKPKPFSLGFIGVVRYASNQQITESKAMSQSGSKLSVRSKVGFISYLVTTLAPMSYGSSSQNTTFTQTYGIAYREMFALVAKMSIVRVPISVAINCVWSLYQMDIKNAFLHGEFEEVYMTFPPKHPQQHNKSLACKL